MSNNNNRKNMSLDKIIKIRELLKESELSFVCQHCVYLWESIERGRVMEGCGRVKTCGGPFIGRDFSDYKPVGWGPRRQDLGKYCFMCGKPSVALIKMVKRGVDGNVERETYLGVCEHHKPILKQGWWGTDKDEEFVRGKVGDFNNIEGEIGRVEKKDFNKVKKVIKDIDIDLKDVE